MFLEPGRGDRAAHLTGLVHSACRLKDFFWGRIVPVEALGVSLDVHDQFIFGGGANDGAARRT